jgi:ATP-dependent Zn protease
MPPSGRFSESSAQAVGDAVKRLLKDAETRAVDLIRKKPQLDRLIKTLEEHETLARDQVKACLGDNTS